jgi:predicted transcriptional regulator
MARHATSLKLPTELKDQVDAAAQAAGTTPHAFMIEAIAREITRAGQYEAFLGEALEAEREHERTGVHYAAEDVFRYMSARAEGKRARRPKPKSWRK